MASLDFQTRNLVERKIKELRNKNKTIILVTHDIIQAKLLGEKIIFMENLNLLGTYNSDEFFDEKLNSI